MIWQAIEDNKRRSWTLFIGMGVVLAALGYFMGMTTLGPKGALSGLWAALAIWSVLSFVSYFFGDQILLSVSGGREITPDIHPKLFNVTEEMRIAAGLTRMPKIYVIDEMAPNAFASGIHPENMSITVTLGLLTRLNRDELQGVIAHEMAHILNRDVLFVTLAGTMLGSVQILSDIFLKGIFHSDSSNARFRSKSSAKGSGAAMILALSVAILAPILIRIFYFSLSRKREFLADACGARLTRYPEGLACALEKISGSGHQVKSANSVTAAMFIVNPFSVENAAQLLSTHPPVNQRIKVLRAMTGSAALSEYQKVFASIVQKTPLIQISPLSELAVSIREASKDEEPNTQTLPASDPRSIGDLMRATHGFAFFPCSCGLKFKIPPDFDEKKITCPRCGFIIDVPFFGKIGKTKINSAQPNKEQTYTRRTKGWESFFCQCGRVIQIAPNFSSPLIACNGCRREIKVS